MMSTYTPTEWLNDEIPSINESNLNKLEQATKDAHDELQDMTDDLESGSLPIPHALENILSINGSGGLGTIRINQMVECTLPEYQNLTPLNDCCYIIRESAIPGSEIFTSSGTFTPKFGYTEYNVSVLGGGGNGGHEAQVGTNRIGDGGQAAVLAESVLTITAPIAITVGIGGVDSLETIIPATASIADTLTSPGGAGGTNGATDLDCGDPVHVGEDSDWGSGGTCSTINGGPGGTGAGGGGGDSLGGPGGRGEVRISWGL